MEYFKVNDPNILSDHCMIDFTFKFQKPCANIAQQNKIYDNITYNYAWDYNKFSDFQNRLSSGNTLERLKTFSCNVNTSTGKADINSRVRELSDILDGVVSPLFKQNLKTPIPNGNDYK